MTDKQKLLHDIASYLDGKSWDVHADYEDLVDIFRSLSVVNFDWRKLNENYEDYYIITYYSKIGKTIIFDEDADCAWDSPEEMADWVLSVMAKIEKQESLLPDLRASQEVVR